MVNPVCLRGWEGARSHQITPAYDLRDEIHVGPQLDLDMSFRDRRFFGLVWSGLVFSGYRPSSGIAGSYGSTVWRFLKKLKIELQFS